MKIFNILALSSFLFLFASCEDVIDITIPQAKKTLVIEGWLTNKAEPNFVKIYYTKGIIGDNSFTMLNQAKVTLTDNLANAEVLQEISAGKYQISALKSIVGRTYTLTIESSAGNYKAVTEVKRLSMPLDSLHFKFEKKSAFYDKEGYYPRSFGQETEGVGDFIQVKLYKNGNYLNQAGDLNLFDDKFVDGNYIGDTELAIKEPFMKNDMAKAEVWSLTEDAYHFWIDLQVQLQNGQIFATPLSNTRTNVIKTSANASDVVGYFGASMVQAIEKKVK